MLYRNCKYQNIPEVYVLADYAAGNDFEALVSVQMLNIHLLILVGVLCHGNFISIPALAILGNATGVAVKEGSTGASY